MSTAPIKQYTPEEYLAIDRQSEHKNQYFAGEIFAMVGASRRHNLIVANLVGELRTQLKDRRCEVYPSDMRVKVSPTGLYTYPDVTVICGEAEFDDGHYDTLLNPTVLIEVLSKTTEDYDRGRKFEHYRQLESLSEYLLVAQEKYHVMRYRRQDEHWETDRPADTVALQSIDCELAVAEIYHKVEFETQASQEAR